MSTWEIMTNLELVKTIRIKTKQNKSISMDKSAPLKVRKIGHLGHI